MLALAGVAAVEVTAEELGATGLDGGHDLESCAVETPGEALTVSSTGVAEDVRHAGDDPLHGGSGAKYSEA